MAYFSINRVVLVGRLTRDPELHGLPSGTSVCGLRLACSSSRRDADGEYRERPNFFDVSVYGNAAENVSRYLRKGSRVAIDGRLEWREWETSDQQRRQAVSILADKVLFLDTPSSRPHGEEPSDGGGERASEEQDPDGELSGVGAGSGEAELVF